MRALLVAEWISGIVALLLTALAFTELSWGEGASAQTMKRDSMARAKRLFIWAAAFWAIAVLCFLYMR